MSEYICKEDLIKDIEQRYCKPCEKEGKDYNHTKCKACWVDDMMGEIVDAPFYDDIKPVLRGEWILKTDDFDFVDGKCSVCGYTDSFFEENWLYDFCPNCGADMRGE